MKSIRWATALTLFVAVAAGCQPTPAPGPQADPMPTHERIAAAKATLAAQGMLVGEVGAVQDSYAHVSGIAPADVNPNDVFSFIDVDTQRVVSNGRLFRPTDSGNLILEATTFGERAPRTGDLAVKVR